MPNWLQKTIYFLSAASPLALCFGYVWWEEKETALVPIICVCVALVIIAMFCASFKYFKKNLPPIQTHFQELASHDTWIIGYVISYFLPFASMAIEEFNLTLSIAIAVCIVLLAPFINTAMPNPLLYVCGYHSYELKSSYGTAYVLISKRKIRNAKDVKTVKRIFEFLLLEEDK